MPKPKPAKDLTRMAASSDALIASALRTLETEAAASTRSPPRSAMGWASRSLPPSS